MPGELRVGIISDIHNGPDRGTKAGSSAKGLFSQFADWVTAAQPDVVADLGDRISDVDRETDEKLAAEVASWFAALKRRRAATPVYHLLGNHDLGKLTQEDNERILGASLASAAFERNGWRLIFWNVDAAVKGEDGAHFLPRKADLEWLAAELQRSDSPTVLFTHIPLDNGTFVGNFYFEEVAAPFATYPAHEGTAIRHIVEGSERVVLCINGHAHWNAYHCVDGIHYATVPALTETFPTYPEPCGSWSLLTLSTGRARLEVFGRLPISYEFPLKALDHHWAHVDKPYSPTKVRPQ